MFGVCRLIDILVPDVPESLSLKIKREHYLAKQALADTDTIMKVSFKLLCEPDLTILCVDFKICGSSDFITLLLMLLCLFIHYSIKLISYFRFKNSQITYYI